MGFISESLTRRPSGKAVPQTGGLWNRVFGTTKESAHDDPPVPDRHGGSRTRTLSASAQSLKHYLLALRSSIPGGWTDDRYEQSRHQVGAVHIVIRTIGSRVQQAEFQVSHRDTSAPDGKRPVLESDPPEGDRMVRPYDLVRLLQKPNPQDYFGKLCFPAGTLVKMADGSFKSIEKVSLLDEVFTAEGNVSVVSQRHVRHHEGNVVQLKLWGHGHLQLTPNHEVLTRRGYVPAGDLRKTDWVALPTCVLEERKILQTAEHVTKEMKAIKGSYIRKVRYAYQRTGPSTKGVAWKCYHKVPDFLNLSPGLGRILGLWLAEGHSGKSGICWSFGIHESKTLVRELVGLLKTEFGIEAWVRVPKKHPTIKQVNVTGKLWRRLFVSLCGRGAAFKRIHPDLLCGPKEFLESLFFGWLAGDGFVTKKGRFSGSSVSKHLAMGMYDVANRLGLKPAIHVDPPGTKPIQGKVPKHRFPLWTVRCGWIKESYEARFKGTVVRRKTNNYRVMEEKGVVWRKVRKVNRRSYFGEVFNLGVEGDNSYIAEGIGVHNCYRWLQQKLLTGTAITWMVPNELGTPMELYCLETGIAVPMPVMSAEFPQGAYRIQPVYPYGPFSSYPLPNAAVGTLVDARWTFKSYYPHPLYRYEGYSPQTGMRLELDTLEAINRSRWYKMKRSSNPDAVLQSKDSESGVPTSEAEIERMLSQWEAAMQGPENHGKLLVPPQGMTLEQFGTVPKDMDWQSGWTQNLDFALAGFGVPKTAAGMADGSSYASLYASLRQLDFTLGPEVADVAAVLTRHLGPFFGEDLIVEVRCPRIDDHDIAFKKVEILDKLKGHAEPVIRMAFTILDLPQDAEVIRSLAESKEDTGALPGNVESESESPQVPESGGPAQERRAEVPEEERAESTEVARNRPTPDKLAEGSLGPRGLSGLRKLYANGRAKVYTNGKR